MHGEADSVNQLDVEKGRKVFQQVTGSYEKRDVFNMDETSLYYCKAPDSTITTTPIPGRKTSKKRMVIAVATNADGGEKLSLMFIGSAAQLRCFEESGTEHGLYYTNSKEGWKTVSCFDRGV